MKTCNTDSRSSRSRKSSLTTAFLLGLFWTFQPKVIAESWISPLLMGALISAYVFMTLRPSERFFIPALAAVGLSVVTIEVGRTAGLMSPAHLACLFGLAAAASGGVLNFSLKSLRLKVYTALLFGPLLSHLGFSDSREAYTLIGLILGFCLALHLGALIPRRPRQLAAAHSPRA